MWTKIKRSCTCSNHLIWTVGLNYIRFIYAMLVHIDWPVEPMSKTLMSMWANWSQINLIDKKKITYIFYYVIIFIL